jgi:hypothetical protein
MGISNVILIVLSIQVSMNERPMPQAGPYFEALSRHLADEHNGTSVLDGYTYHLKRTLAEVANDGKLNTKETEEYDIINKDGLPLRKLVSKNGKPPNANGAEEPKYEPSRHQPDSPEAIIQANKVAEDALHILNLRLVRREMVANRPAIVVAFSPRPKATPVTSRGKELLKRIEGEAWVDETDHVVSRISWRFLESSGGNAVIKSEKGATMSREWLKFRDEVWLPAHSESRSSFRFFFGKRISVLRREDYSEYKKFVSETTIKVSQ